MSWPPSRRRGTEEESKLITPKPSRVHKSAGPVTRPSAHPNFISDGEESDTGAAAADTGTDWTSPDVS